MGLKVGIWEPLWALSIYHIPTWTLWGNAGFLAESEETLHVAYPNIFTPVDLSHELAALFKSVRGVRV